MATLATSRRNLGKTKASVNMGLIKGIIVTPDGFSLSSTNKLLKAQWQNALLDTVANRIHLFPKFNELKDESEKVVIDSTELSDQFVRNGRRRFEVAITKSFYLHQSIQTYAGAVARLFLIDTNNNIWGQVDSSGNFFGYSVELFQPESLTLNDGKKPAQSLIKISLSDSTEIDSAGSYVAAQAFFGQLKELVDVDLAQVGSGTTSLFKVTVTVDADGSSVDGLVAADFTVKSSVGVSRTITSVTQDLSVTPGVYSINSSAAFTVGDTVQLVSAATLSIPGYESTGGIVTS